MLSQRSLKQSLLHKWCVTTNDWWKHSHVCFKSLFLMLADKFRIWLTNWWNHFISTFWYYIFGTVHSYLTPFFQFWLMNWWNSLTSTSFFSKIVFLAQLTHTSDLFPLFTIIFIDWVTHSLQPIILLVKLICKILFNSILKERSWPCILFIDKLIYVTFNVFTSLCYNGISQ